MTINITAIVAALFGTLAGGFAHYWFARRSARIGRSAMLTALVAEVAVLLHLLEAQFNTDDRTDVDGPGPIAVFPIVYRGSLASVYEGLSTKLGDLDRHTADTIVRFHTLYKIVVGVSELRGIAAVDRRLVDELIQLGQQIVALRNRTD